MDRSECERQMKRPDATMPSLAQAICGLTGSGALRSRPARIHPRLQAMTRVILLSSVLASGLTCQLVAGAADLQPIPDKLVVLTFDDSVASHYSVVRPLLKQYGFGAT